MSGERSDWRERLDERSR